MITNLAILTILAGTPLLLAVLGELVLQKSGLINIGLEGMLLVATLTAMAGAAASSSLLVGFISGVFGALVVGFLFGMLTVQFRADQIVAGTALNLLAIGITGLVAHRFSQVRARTGDELSAAIVFDRIDLIALASWTLAPIAVALFLRHSRAGLRLRACGESPASLRGGGLFPERYQWIAIIIESILAGAGGAYLSLVLSPGFAENMVAGRGFIALAIVIFARWNAIGAIGGVALFGCASAAQYALQAAQTDVPYQLLLAIPYALTLVVLAISATRVRAPEWLGKPLE